MHFYNKSIEYTYSSFLISVLRYLEAMTFAPALVGTDIGIFTLQNFK